MLPQAVADNSILRVLDMLSNGKAMVGVQPAGSTLTGRLCQHLRRTCQKPTSISPARHASEGWQLIRGKQQTRRVKREMNLRRMRTSLGIRKTRTRESVAAARQRNGRSAALSLDCACTVDKLLGGLGASQHPGAVLAFARGNPRDAKTVH